MRNSNATRSLERTHQTLAAWHQASWTIITQALNHALARPINFAAVPAIESHPGFFT